MLDHGVIEFAASLPIGLEYTRDGRQERVLKEAVAPLLRQPHRSEEVGVLLTAPVLVCRSSHAAVPGAGVGKGRYSTPHFAVVRRRFEEADKISQDAGFSSGPSSCSSYGFAGTPSAAAHAVPLRTPARRDLPAAESGGPSES